MYQPYDPERIGLLPEWLLLFIKTYNKNIDGARFKVGDNVTYAGRKSNHTILAVKAGDGFEYAIDNHYFLVWETELSPITK